MLDECIKFMDEKLNNSHHTYGIEIEIMPVDKNASTNETEIHRKKEELAVKLNDAGIRARAEGYTHDTVSYWKLVTDRSVMPGFEIVSPILQGSSGLKNLKTVLDVVVDNDYCTTKSCGFHVHVGGQHLNANDLRNIINRFIKFEENLDLIMPDARRKDNNRYCMSNKRILDGYRPSWFSSTSDRSNLAKVFGADRDSRYVKLNLLSYLRQSTIEFRQHSGTTDIDKAAAWVVFCLNFIESSRTNVTRVRELTFPFDTDSKAYKLLRLLKIGTTIANAAVELSTSESTVRTIINTQIRNRAGIFVSKDRNGVFRTTLPFLEPEEIAKQMTPETSEFFGLPKKLIEYFDDRKEFFANNMA